MNIKNKQKEIIATFSFFEDWTEKYEYIIDLGKSLKPIENHYKTEENEIKGCQSKVWLFAKKKEGKIHFLADGDAIITKGIIALLLEVFQGQSAQDILDSDMDFIDTIGLKEHLSPTRANGLLSMIRQIKLYAMALKSKN